MKPRPATGRAGLGVVAALAFATLLMWALRDRGAEAAAGPALSAPNVAAMPMRPLPEPAPAASTAGPPLSPLGQAQRREQLALWQGRLERARTTLENYRHAAQYPHESRPAEEHPDQLRPFEPIAEDRALRMPGGSVTQGVHLKTTQERVFASGDESSRITLMLTDDHGRMLPLRVTRAVMQEVTPPGRTAGTVPVPLVVSDDGRGQLSALMHPARQGFGQFAGTVRLELSLDYAGQPGFLYFDLNYSPEQAATWLPGVREAQSSGSLDFFVKAQVLLPGRYVVSGRIDDAQGQPVALALFNGEVRAGTVEFRLPVFGKLLRDKAPPFPLVLRDVEAFLLKPDTFPDRVMLPRRAGVLHTSRSYPLAAFSDAEWSSEERTRYLTELGRDVATAERQVQALGGP
ncbi:MAG: hypothetical protein JNM33_17210 [Rubrivivax sp.]|nr:hypothetical protein [Rubrivivax sp.]